MTVKNDTTKKTIARWPPRLRPAIRKNMPPPTQFVRMAPLAPVSPNRISAFVGIRSCPAFDVAIYFPSMKSTPTSSSAPPAGQLSLFFPFSSFFIGASYREDSLKPPDAVPVPPTPSEAAVPAVRGLEQLVIVKKRPNMAPPNVTGKSVRSDTGAGVRLFQLQLGQLHIPQVVALARFVIRRKSSPASREEENDDELLSRFARFGFDKAALQTVLSTAPTATVPLV